MLYASATARLEEEACRPRGFFKSAGWIQSKRGFAMPELNLQQDDHQVKDDMIARARSVRIEGLLRRRGIQLKGSGSNLKCPCPKCGGTERFGLNTQTQQFICHKCDGRGRGAISFITWLHNIDHNRAVEILTQQQLPTTRRRQIEPGSGTYGTDVGGVACEASGGAFAIAPISASPATKF
jgi:CHC2 zinc finger